MEQIFGWERVEELLLQNSDALSSLGFFWLLTLAALLEHYWPKRSIEAPHYKRWLTHLGLWGVNAIVIWLVVPVAAIGLALFCSQQGWGLFNIIAAPDWLVISISLLALDFTRFLQHAILHQVPVLWRFHRSHHTDIAVDFSTLWRFHPFEAVFTTTVIYAAITLFGVPAYVIVINTLITHFTGFFTHSNFAIPERAERLLRLLFITPDVHRVHHSADKQEMSRNFGNLLCLWDQMFGTYVAQPAKGQSGMQLGLSEYQDAKYATLPRILWMPFEPLAKSGPAPQILK